MTDEDVLYVTWTVVENHSANFTARRLADLLGVTVEKLRANLDDPDGLGLADSLADLDDDDTFDGRTREDITVTEVH